ncbi:hypothetical protein ILUMI_04935 [Ignelater luminosus]|uniref:Uncharacterized protein n=1 Tax=Ignelater luminosus TaxID=2038154 RepID=A0A8K0D881_IGNLU|nr:hypothetical protein ILUMI_04935 [Ignelater luminosus]
MKSIICVYLVMQLLVAESKPLLDAVKPCHMSDPDFKTCYSNFINKGIALLNNEIPGYKIPIPNPYRIPSVNIDINIENLGSTNGTFRNIKITNPFKVKVNDIKYELENLVFEYNVTHPKVGIEFEYLLDGKLFDNPVHSEGSIKAKLALLNSNLRFVFKIVERRGVKYYTIDDFKLQMSVGDAVVHIIAKDPKEQSTADFVQDLFNQNAHLYMDMLNPFYVERIERLLRPLLNGVLAIVPADRLLLE